MSIPNAASMQPSEPKKKHMEKVISGTAKIKRDHKEFIREEIESRFDNARAYAWTEILVPAFLKAISDIVTNGVDMIIYGEAGHTKRKKRGGHTSYDEYYDSEAPRRSERTMRRTSFDVGEIILDSRREGEDVLCRLQDELEEYGVVSVADLYEACGLSCDHTAYNFGWTNIDSAEVIRTHGGYTFSMPRYKAL